MRCGFCAIFAVGCRLCFGDIEVMRKVDVMALISLEENCGKRCSYSLPLCSCLTCAPRSPELPLVFSGHLHSVTRPLSSFPEPASSSLPTHHPVTDSTVFRPVVLLSTAPPADHPVRPLVWMLLFFIVAFIARIYFLTTAESKPSVALRVMATATSFGEFGAGLETECLFLAARARGR